MTLTFDAHVNEGFLNCPYCKTATPDTETEWAPKCYQGTVERCPKCGYGFEPEDFRKVSGYLKTTPLFSL